MLLRILRFVALMWLVVLVMGVALIAGHYVFDLSARVWRRLARRR